MIAAMLVRDRGEMWQLVRQPDHGDLAGQLARAWGGPDVEALRGAASLALAATRHDDGWATYDRRPTWDPERRQPRAFLDVPIAVHLAFYRACIEVVSDEDPYAGLLVSMHGAGIYNGRYGTQPELKMTLADQAREAVDAFVREQEAARERRAAALGIGEGELWTNYRLLQVFDRLSLSLCLREWESSDAEADTISPCPLDYAGTETELRLTPLGPWRIGFDPYPFAESPARFTLVRKLLPMGAYHGNEDFRAAYFATRAQLVDITAERV